MFMVSMGLALIGYALYPTAPPGFYSQYGFVDTINDFSSVNHDSAWPRSSSTPMRRCPACTAPSRR